MKDYYGILSVSKNASQEEIKKSFRKLATQYHPDKNPGNRTAEEKFKEINEAYQILGDPEKRKQYDHGGFNSINFEDVPIDPEILKELGIDFGRGLESIFDIFGQRKKARTTKDPHLNLELTIEEAFTGIQKDLSYHIGNCQTCQGSGYQTIQSMQGRSVLRETITCKDCYGVGYVAVQGGDQKVKVTIPAGVDEGSKLKLSGKGVEGGDFYIDIKMKPHELYKREGDNLYADTKVSIPEAVFGTEKEVKTLEGLKSIKIPKGVQAGGKMKLKGYGMPNLKTSQRGDLYVVIKVEIPKELTKEQEEAFRNLEKVI